MSDIILYGAEWCQSCQALKNQLESKNIPFEYRDADERENKIALADRGVRSIPFAIKDGESLYTPVLEDFI